MATICTDLTVKETVQEVKKKPIEFISMICVDGETVKASSHPSLWKKIYRIAILDKENTLSIMRAVCDGGEVILIGYWNDGVAE